MPLLSPISVGFVLDNRYEVAQFLGYGGFGRTYLARDRQRFSELCVLKEFAPQISSPEILRKAAELFQREAGTLYQLRHPQIPEFRAILQTQIDGNEILLIIEQYIAGETYEQWVDAGNRLDELGAFQFLQDLLPVLSYVHDRGVIHRDIAPDNLIRETRTTKPFLIDFGSVKQVATTAMQMSGVMSGTQIHKPGFSPPEQLRGEVTPSTDLYSLAVTTLVLMTGRSPLELYDVQTATWRWREFLSLSPGFGNFLDRLLAHQSNNRPSNALATQQMLQSIAGISGLIPGDLAPYIPAQPIAPIASISPIAPNPRVSIAHRAAPVSQMRTIAIAPPGSAFPTTYPIPRLARQSDRGAAMQNPSDRDPGFNNSDRQTPDRHEPKEDILLSVIKIPWEILVWSLRGLWLGVKAIDWVLTWMWRGVLILGLLASGAVGSYLWSLRSQPQAQIEPPQQSRPASEASPDSQQPGIEWPQIPKISLPEVKFPTLPTIKFPDLKLPEMKLPEVKLPDWSNGKNESCSETIAHYKEHGFTQGQFYQIVNSRFRAKHPDLNDRMLTDRPEDAGLRQDWCSIAEQVLADTPKTQ